MRSYNAVAEITFNFFQNCHSYALQNDLDDITKENNKEPNEKWYHPYRILIIGGPGTGKTSMLFNLINEQNDINKMYLYWKDLSESKYNFLIKKLKKRRNKAFKWSKLIYWVFQSDGCRLWNTDDYNPNRKRKTLIVFDVVIADMMTNKKFQAIIKELFIRCKKLNILLVFITQSYFSVPKDVRLNSTHCLIMKIKQLNNQKELKNIAINHSAEINYKDFMRTIFFFDNW